MWRNVVDEQTGELRVSDEPADEGLRRLVHRTIDGVRSDMEGLRFNTAIAKLAELNNELTRRGTGAPREVADTMVRMLAPLVPHFAEELWHRLHGPDAGSVTQAEFPTADPAMLVQHTVELPVQCERQAQGQGDHPGRRGPSRCGGCRSGRAERCRPCRRARPAQADLRPGPHDHARRVNSARSGPLDEPSQGGVAVYTALCRNHR